MLAALDYLTQRSSVRSRIDTSRLGVMGHSMGGGGTLEAAKSRPSLQAAIPLTGWNLDTTWPEVRTPTLVVGADGDTIAPVATHSEPFYRSLPGSLDKAYLELRGCHPLHAQQLQHHDREVQHRVAEAVHRRRHPLRAVPLPAAAAVPHDRRVPGHLPAHLLTPTPPARVGAAIA